jgi:hypothetical protein
MGSDQVSQVTPITLSVEEGQYVLCVRFDSVPISLPNQKQKGRCSVSSSVFSLPNSPTDGSFSSPSGDDSGTGDTENEKDDVLREEYGSGKGEWVVMDMLDGHGESPQMSSYPPPHFLFHSI